MIKAVLFDLGGTLHTASRPEGSMERYAARVIERLGDYGITLSDTPEHFAQTLYQNSEAYKKDSEKTMRELPPAEVWSDWYLKGYGIDRERIAPIAEELSFRYDYDRQVVMRRPHMEDTLRLLHEQGYRLGVISNIISLSVVGHFLEEYGVRDLMDCVITSSGTGIRKPSAEIYRVAERELGLAPEELAYVGDTISRDVIGTRNAGWRLMIQIVNPGIAHRDAGLENSGYVPDYRITDLAEIPAILAAENGRG